MVCDKEMVPVPSEDVLKCKEEEEKFHSNNNNLFLFDDEVASLLLDMRQRLQKPQTLLEAEQPEHYDSRCVEYFTSVFVFVKKKRRELYSHLSEGCCAKYWSIDLFVNRTFTHSLSSFFFFFDLLSEILQSCRAP